MIRRVLMTLILAALATPFAYASDAADEDSVAVQAAREKWVKNKGYKVYYTKKFDLSDLPHYKPEQKVSGTIRMWGSNYFTDSPLADYWVQEFQKYQPDVKFALHLKTTLHAIPGLIFGMSDIGPMGRQITWDELLSYQRERNHLPIGIVAVTGSYDVSGWNPPIGVYLHKDNPLSKLSLQQLDGIFGAQRSGAWRELVWDKSLARGPEKNIRTWGQLGLTGEWANKPIHVYGYNLQFHFPQEIESRAFGGVSGKWNENLIEYDNLAQPDGSFKLAGQLMLEDLAKDPYGIVYCAGGNAWLTPQVKPIALSVKTGDPAYELTLENVRERKYPMYADVFFYIDRDPKKPVDPKVKEFLRYILSSEGQTQVMRDGKYLPLTAETVRAQLKLLE
ncbi:MAG TPA: phosphate ABC transporter substrate-binding protein [Casimicrobiaceae bacterium]|jgi:phosphate transport system substrate-binding protein|nr:phosphate ABC transporter substrate-binding protein [Casimicrobiaceae bacterium]